MFYVVLKEATTTSIILCHSPRNNDIEDVCFVVSSGRKWLAIRICKLLIARSTNSNECIFYVTSRGSKQQYNNTTIARTRGTVVKVWQWWPTTQQSNIIYAVIQNDDGKWAHTARRDDNEHTFYIILQKKQQHNTLMLQEAVVLPGSVQRQ